MGVVFFLLVAVISQKKNLFVYLFVWVRCAFLIHLRHNWSIKTWRISCSCYTYYHLIHVYPIFLTMIIIQKSHSFTVPNVGLYPWRSLELIELRPDQALMVYQKSGAYWQLSCLHGGDRNFSKEILFAARWCGYWEGRIMIAKAGEKGGITWYIYMESLVATET